VQEAAQRRGVNPEAYADQVVTRFQETWKDLEISCDDFIRTTQARHIRVVRAVLQGLWEKGEIYRGDYQGWYCVPDERFWTEKDLVDGRCPDCLRPVEEIVEPNYFFRMSAYQSWLIAYIEAHPGFIQPAHRRNEVLGFLRQPLGDLCISRPKTRLSWGIPLPFDPQFVTYVWFDALLNYVTAAGYLEDEVRFNAIWPNALHLVGKDILTTHSVYWPTMLQAIGLPQPRAIFAHGWWVIQGEKMSKRSGNAIKPLDLVASFGADAFRYLLIREMTPGQDAEFDPVRLVSSYQTDLANTLGNLLHRVVNMIERYCSGLIPEPEVETATESILRIECEELADKIFAKVDALLVNQALAQIMEVLETVNRYLEQSAPWKLAKTGPAERIGTILYNAAETIRIASILLQPVLPKKSAELWRRLGWQSPKVLREGLVWGRLVPGTPVTAGEPLFPRLA